MQVRVVRGIRDIDDVREGRPVAGRGELAAGDGDLGLVDEVVVDRVPGLRGGVSCASSAPDKMVDGLALKLMTVVASASAGSPLVQALEFGRPS